MKKAASGTTSRTSTPHAHGTGEAADRHPLPRGGFVEWDADTWFEVTHPDSMPAFLMTVATDSDVWMFVSSNGGLTAGRGSPENALFPYETVDKLHDVHHHTGSVTVLRLRDEQGKEFTWQPFADAVPPASVQRKLYKNTTGSRLVFEEHDAKLELTFRVQWSTSTRLGIVRTATLCNHSSRTRTIQLLDGLRNILPYGAPLALQQKSSSLVDAYKRCDLDPHTRLATYALTSKILDRAEAGEVLRANVVWCAGLPAFDVCLSHEALTAFRRGEALPRDQSLKGQRGNYLVSTQVELPAQQEKTWHLVGDVGLSHVQLAKLRLQLMQTPDLLRMIDKQVIRTGHSLRRIVASADGVQVSAQKATMHHHFANVLFNCMRGGVFVDNGRVALEDLRRLLHTRNQRVAQQHAATLGSGTESAADGHSLSRAELMRRAEETNDADLRRLCCEYLPLTFGRRHGDPSRPWNRFDIRVHSVDGSHALHYEGNWRDIFQNWEALSWSFPEYLPSFIAKFVNASTVDGFNPYRISREGIDWEVIDPHDPWSNIGYWGDHQIVYLTKFLETLDRFDPGALEAMLLQDIFSYADVPYRLKAYDAIVANPRQTIEFDEARARKVAARVEAIGSDGRLVSDASGAVYHATLIEKLLVPALSKLSNLVVDAGIWMNTQRPEWNDANNALVGNGVSMVTLCYLRRYLAFLDERINDRFTTANVSKEIVTWLQEVTEVLQRHESALDYETKQDMMRRQVLDELGRSFERYRSVVTSDGFGGKVPLRSEQVRSLCHTALTYLDHAIHANRRQDGLYHSYNLMEFGSAANEDPVIKVQRLPQMLEGQVAALSSGVVPVSQVAALVEALYASALYRADQDSFLLYPDVDLPGFMERNVVPADGVQSVPLLQTLVDGDDTTLVERDALGVLRFQADIANAHDVNDILDRLSQDANLTKQVAQDRPAVLALFESVFQHTRFTGRSGSMYAYEGLGSVYWHMVAKLLLAVQENVQRALVEEQPQRVLAQLEAAYVRIRSGLGFTKSVAEFGAIPTDPYSHTPSYSGAQQPGMTGQVKEEILTRLGELGVRVAEGRLGFQPSLLCEDEFLDQQERVEFYSVSGERHMLDVAAGSLAFTFCQTPVVFERSTTAWIRVIRAESAEKATSSAAGTALDVETSREVFTRSGAIIRIEVGIPTT